MLKEIVMNADIMNLAPAFPHYSLSVDHLVGILFPGNLRCLAIVIGEIHVPAAEIPWGGG